MCAVFCWFCGEVCKVSAMLGVVHSRRYTNVLSWEWVGCKGYVGGNRREVPIPSLCVYLYTCTRAYVGCVYMYCKDIVKSAICQ